MLHKNTLKKLVILPIDKNSTRADWARAAKKSIGNLHKKAGGLVRLLIKYM